MIILMLTVYNIGSLVRTLEPTGRKKNLFLKNHISVLTSCNAFHSKQLSTLETETYVCLYD